MKPKNVKEIVAVWLVSHGFAGLASKHGRCSCTYKNEDFMLCNNSRCCVPAVKRRRMVDGKRRTMLVPVE